MKTAKVKRKITPAARSNGISPVQGNVLQRQCACGQHTGSGGKCEECKKNRSLQRGSMNGTPVAAVPPIVQEVLEMPGRPLDLAARGFMESRFALDFSGVRVHKDARAAESARAVNALAYTVGRNVVFGAGQYAPATMAGKRLLAHELTHVAQQGATLRCSDSVGAEHDTAEQEAETIAERVITGAGPLKIGPASVPIMQRQAAGSGPPAKEELANDPYPGTPTGEQIGLFSLSDEGFDFLVRHEGLIMHLYNDSAGHCTIGVGHLVHKGNCNGTESAEFKAGITRELALDLFRVDVERFEEIVSNNVTVRINQAQYDALVSFTFNTGHLAGTNVLRELNLGLYSKVPGAMMQWVKPPELRGRRTDEANLFRTGNY
jgi:GH24 family phage-related lysozyme (muramidase)